MRASLRNRFFKKHVTFPAGLREAVKQKKERLSYGNFPWGGGTIGKTRPSKGRMEMRMHLFALTTIGPAKWD